MKCIKCKNVHNLLQLLCNHDICLNCWNSLKTTEYLTQMDQKYRIYCPKCQKPTLTYGHEILIKKKPKTKSKADSGRSTPVKRFEATQISTPKKEQILCLQHKLPYYEFCCMEQMLLCQQCIKQHCTKKSEIYTHKIIKLQAALPLILKKNQIFKAENRKKMQQIEKKMSRYEHIKNEYERKKTQTLQEIINEFKKIDMVIEKKKLQLKTELACALDTEIEQLGRQIQHLGQLCGCMKQYDNFDAFNKKCEVRFYSSYVNLRKITEKIDNKNEPKYFFKIELYKNQVFDSIQKEVDSFLNIKVGKQQLDMRTSHKHQHSKSLKKSRGTRSYSDLHQVEPKNQPPKMSFHEKKAKKKTSDKKIYYS